MSALRVALKAVENEFFEEEVDLWPAENEQGAHSLHYALGLPDSLRPEFAAYFIDRFSKRGDVVLDPFCGAGATALEANLRSRVAFFSDVSPLALRVAKAKVEPADISEVTLRLQQINLRRPISARGFETTFSEFYDIETFRELVNLRAFIVQNDDRTSRFLQLTALSLLHGPSAGYFSVYSFPQVALSPQEQRELNLKRGQVPDFRAVAPRVLRRVASVLRDGIPSAFRQLEFKNRSFVSDARNLSQLQSGSVDLVVTAAPLPSSRDYSSSLWLKNWFCNLEVNQKSAAPAFRTLQSWRDFMNEVLLEMARLVKTGGRVVLDLCEMDLCEERVYLDRELMQMVNSNLSKFFESEGVIVEKIKSAALKNCLKERDDLRMRGRSRTLVLRRR